MRRPYRLLVLVLAFVLLIIVVGEVLSLSQSAAGVHPLFGWAVGLILGGVVIAAMILAIYLGMSFSAGTRIPRSGSRRHRRYVVHLTRRHLRHPVTSLNGLPVDNQAMLETLYRRLDEQAASLTATTAEGVFFHTAISQSGHLDALAALRGQLRLVRRLARLYAPRFGTALRLPLYHTTARAALGLSRQEEVDLGAQIGPAIVGASVVGAIPGANLVSLIIADAVIQGSANALAVFRTGLLARRYFHCRLEGVYFDPAVERRAVNPEALERLSRLVTTASGVLSRAIWDAAKDNLRRMPAATYDGLKSLVSRSVRGLSHKRSEGSEEGDVDQDITPTSGD